MEKRWYPAEIPPSGTMGKWSREVVVLTNFGDVFQLTFFHGTDGYGHWQRHAKFNHGEEVAWWIDKPNS